MRPLSKTKKSRDSGIETGKRAKQAQAYNRTQLSKPSESSEGAVNHDAGMNGYVIMISQLMIL